MEPSLGYSGKYLKKTNKNEAIPVNVSFKWVDGKIVSARWIFDPSIKIQEIVASQK